MPDPEVEEILKAIGERIYVGRRDLGVSQEWLGRACGLSQSEISRLERGQTPSMRLERYARLLAVLGTGVPLGPWLPGDRGDGRLLHTRTRRDPSDLLAHAATDMT
jgi:transcriptional regulator with XRE-family HTH domain